MRACQSFSVPVLDGTRLRYWSLPFPFHFPTLDPNLINLKENPNQRRVVDEIGDGWLTFWLVITNLFQKKIKEKKVFSIKFIVYF